VPKKKDLEVGVLPSGNGWKSVLYWVAELESYSVRVSEIKCGSTSCICSFGKKSGINCAVPV
jgi:hypothetical protein